MELFKNSKICPATNAGYTIIENTEYPDTDGTILGNVLAQNANGDIAMWATWEYSYFPKSDYFNGFNEGNYFGKDNKAEAYADYHTRCAKRIEHIAAAENVITDNREVETNIGTMPIEDYREIVAVQNGFDSYSDMRRQGIKLGNEYDTAVEKSVCITPFYTHDFAYARDRNEEEIWGKSYHANYDCASDIDKAISENYNNNRLDAKGALDAVTVKYGNERVTFLVAAKVNASEWDLRYDKHVKAWARETCEKFESDFVKRHVSFNAHSGLVNMVAQRIMTREEYEKHFENAAKDFVSADFQCDAAGGAPCSLCWNFENRNVWLEPNATLFNADSAEYQKAKEACADWGVHSCKDKEQLASILKRLGEEAYENNAVYLELTNEYEGSDMEP